MEFALKGVGRRKKMKRLALVALAVFVIAAGAFAQEAKPEAKYVDDSFVRLSLINGNVYVQRAADLGFEQGQLNMPVAEGDRIGTTDGRAEISLGKRNFIRLDQNTKIDFVNLPRKDSSLTRIRVWAGNAYVDINALGKEKDIEILTSDATFYILDKGVYRINVQENKETEIMVFTGVVEASGEEGSVLVKSEQRISLSEGRFLDKPKSFTAVPDDAFDRFNESRSSEVFKQYDQRYLPAELEEYETELADYGNWVYSPEFGYVWVPRGIGADWRPYYNGRWTWLSMAGWTWIPFEPWGWAPFHYGRWHWGLGMGWYWIPMSMWGPAWVNWWWDDYYYGWAPMSYWGYPGVIIDNFYYGRGWRGDYPINSRAVTIISRNQLQSPDMRRAALGPDSLRSVSKVNLTERSLNVKPSGAGKISVEQLGGGNKVIMRKSGESATLEKVNKPSPGVIPERMIRDPKTEAPKSGDAVKKSGATAPDASGSGRISPSAGKVAPVTKSSGPERNIRKKDGEPGSLSSNSFPSRVQSFGFPSRVAPKSGASSSGSRISSSGSVLDRIFKSFSGSSGSSRSSSGSVSRGSTSGRSVSRPSVSRGSSGGSARSGGSIRKK
jgi:hypothetical protein